MATREHITVDGNYLDEGTLAALDDVSDLIEIKAGFLVQLTGTFVGTVQLQVCRGKENLGDNDNWAPVSTDGAGTDADFVEPMSVRGHEPLSDMFYRLKCTSYASGTVSYKLGGS
ncbi:MAG: hypothetical protein JKY94_01000 [Rhodobacteraceae bacterium]|nr:hypothetical protein [Paracoccaceae bacterium]